MGNRERYPELQELYGEDWETAADLTAQLAEALGNQGTPHLSERVQETEKEMRRGKPTGNL